MGYQTVGFTPVPRQIVLPRAAQNIEAAFGTSLDVEVTKTIKSLGKENVRLKNLWFERLLAIDHPKLNVDETLRVDFIMLLADYLKTCGYIDSMPTLVDYVISPLLTLDQSVDLMCSHFMPTYTAAEIGGDYATIDALTYKFATVIRDTSNVLNYRRGIVDNIRLWLGDIGFRLLQRQSISQQERTAFVLYGNTLEGSFGWSRHVDSGPIPCAHTDTPLMREAAELYKSSTAPGPWTNHIRVISDGSLERLTVFIGHIVPTLTVFTGAKRIYNDFVHFEVTPHETISWSPEDQIVGITSDAQYFARANGGGMFQIRVPLMVKLPQEITRSIIPDLDFLDITVLDPRDISKYKITFWSKWRERSVDSSVTNNTMELPLIDMAIQTRSIGGTQAPHVTLEGFGLCRLMEAARKFVIDVDMSRVVETYLLPKDGGVEELPVDMTAYYARQGKIQLLPGFAEGLIVPTKWFATPQPAVVDYVSAVTGLLYDEKVRFADVISMYHNVARFERVTARTANFDVLTLSKTLLKIKD